MPLADGANFAGYTIERLLGAGGMGEVYLVRHPRLPKREALKVLPETVSADAEFRQRFAREADLAASLWHPHIVAVHDRGEYRGQLWITMDYVDGTDAAALMRNRYPLGMPANEAFEIVAAIADALDYAHESSLLHRDVKPANILVTNPHVGSRRVLLADFGIARGTGEATGITSTNMTVGSVAYAAPEQLMGKALDGRADQYALACTAFHLLSGAPPFGDSNPAVVIGNHLSAAAPQLGTLRADLSGIDHVLAKAMAKEPYERFSSCRAFAAALADSGAGSVAYSDRTQYAYPTASPVPQTVTRDPDPPAAAETSQITISRRAALIAGGVVALLAVGFVSFMGARLGQPESPSASPTSTPRSSLIYPEPTGAPTRPPRTITETAPPRTVTTEAPAPPPPPRPPPRPTVLPGDLGLATPISRPACNGQGIVVLGNVTTPGQYPSGVQRLLNLHPGASYLRTDQSCPSLRQASDEGNPIYAVYRTAGSGLAQLCAAVRAAGGDAYGKILDTTTDPSYIPC
ncbi:serine/threonine-protein kinase [Mycolicibacterium iranicum]|uniref:non-specific serine/threonine protein kinase n=1 Tax=Mycolicibacterium iranicum TaxID=912594 RepID=A0ABT4HNB9_MYCIR|nr:serine/threonine-protein kinase [Mycolicibacterium iranicum]MCZ0731249.1 serine/threonine-protein kinase [Mycolicibacterium iranicum]